MAPFFRSALVSAKDTKLLEAAQVTLVQEHPFEWISPVGFTSHQAKRGNEGNSTNLPWPLFFKEGNRSIEACGPKSSNLGRD
jgi:hypothetical protein